MTTAEHMAELTEQVLVRFREELAEAFGDDEVLHLARRAEARFSTDLGRRMRALVDTERYSRARDAVVLFIHEARCDARATGRCSGYSATDYARADEVLLMCRWDDAIAVMRAWQARGYVGDWHTVAGDR